MHLAFSHCWWEAVEDMSGGVMMRDCFQTEELVGAVSIRRHVEGRKTRKMGYVVLEG